MFNRISWKVPGDKCLNDRKYVVVWQKSYYLFLKKEHEYG